MKNSSKKYVAAAFLSIIFGVHAVYQYVPSVSAVHTLPKKVLSVSDTITKNKVDGSNPVVSQADPKHIVLIGTTTPAPVPTEVPATLPPSDPAVAIVPPRPEAPQPEPVVPTIQPPLPTKKKEGKWEITNQINHNRSSHHPGFRLHGQTTWNDRTFRSSGKSVGERDKRKNKSSSQYEPFSPS